MENYTNAQPEDEYSDIDIPHFNNEKELNKELEEIQEFTKDNSADWKKRESAIKRLGGIILSNMSNHSSFIKLFNLKICLNLSVQLVDLRSSLMKEACRITILAAKVYHEAIESAIEKMVSPLVLFKLVGSANKLISDTGANCIFEIVKNVESAKLIVRIHEQIKNKNSTVRLRCCQQLLWIVSNYSKATINKQINLIEEFIQSMIHDANMEVRACARKLFIKYLESFPANANKLISSFDNNVVKTINEEINTGGEKTVDDGNAMFNNIPKARTQSSKVSGSNANNILIIANNTNKSLNMKSDTIKFNSNNNGKIDQTYSPPKKNVNFSMNLSTTLSSPKKNAQYNSNTSSTTLSPPKKNLQFLTNSSTSGSVPKTLPRTETKKSVNKQVELRNKSNDKSKTAIKNVNPIKKDYFNNYPSQENVDKAERDNCDSNNSPVNYRCTNNGNIPMPNDSKPKFKNIEDLIKSKINTIISLSQNDIQKKVMNFEYISSLFNEIYSNIDYISKNTLKNLINIHISNLIETNQKLSIQVMKNLTKFIFYLDDIFNEENIFKITKIVIINISSDNEQIALNSNALFEIMRKKIDPNLIIKPIIEVMEGDTENVILEICFEVINPLIDMAVLTLSDQIYLNNFIKKMFDILLSIDSDNNSTELKFKILDCFELIYRKYPKQFLIAFKDLNLKEDKYFMKLFEINKRGIYDYINKYISNSSSNANSSISMNNSVSMNSTNASLGNNTIFSSGKKNNNSENNKNNIQNNTIKYHQYIDNYDVSDVNFEILSKAEACESSAFISYLKSDPSANVENFLLALIKVKYEQVFPILLHIQKILKSNDRELFLDNMPLFINRLIFLLEKFSTEYSDLLKDIIMHIPLQLDKEIYLQIIPKYITSRQSPHIVQTLLNSIKNVLNYFSNNAENLLLLLPSFIETVFNTLNHHISDVRKLAVYCIVDLHFILGKDFETYLSELNPSQRNLINIYIKKKQECINNGYK